MTSHEAARIMLSLPEAPLMLDGQEGGDDYPMTEASYLEAEADRKRREEIRSKLVCSDTYTDYYITNISVPAGW